MNQILEDTELFRKRPVSVEAITRLKELCDYPECEQIECLALKCALAALDEMSARFEIQVTVK